MPQVFWPFPVSTVTEWPASPGRPNHWGTDFGVTQGTPLRATVDGVIVRHNNDGLGAYVLDIISDDGLLVRNGHLSRMDVNTGQRVTAGQVIGLTGGQPGTPGAGYSTGPHLHWELRWDRAWSGGAWVDPRKMVPAVKSFGDVPSSDEGDVVKIIIGGTVALVGEYESAVYTSMGGGQGFSIEANSKAYGSVSGFTQDQVTTLVNEARGRRDGLIRSIVDQLRPIIAAEVAKAAQGGVTAQVDYARIADAVLDAQAKRLAE